MFSMRSNPFDVQTFVRLVLHISQPLYLSDDSYLSVSETYNTFPVGSQIITNHNLVYFSFNPHVGCLDFS